MGSGGNEMYLFVGLFDNALDIIGIVTLIYLTIKGTRWVMRKRSGNV